MAYFRPIDTTLGEEQVELSRKDKLRCVCPSLAPTKLPGSSEWGYPAAGGWTVGERNRGSGR
jgi:hypothetical protein